MKRLKCPECGASVKILPEEAGHILGRCGNCGAEFLLHLQGRQHLVIEHRFERGAAPPAGPAPAAFDRRKALLLGAALALGGAALFSNRLPSSPKGAGGETAPGFADLRFNKGGEGAAAGLLRGTVTDLGIDSLGRALLIDNDNRFYVFGPDGEFIAHFALTADLRGKFCTLLPAGELILARHDRFLRLGLLDGRLIESVEKQDPYGWSSCFCPLPSGGFAAYQSHDTATGREGDDPVSDQLTLFGPDLKPRKHYENLMAQAIAPEPMIRRPPVVSALALSASGLIYLNVHALEDHDSRGGIYEYNGEGRLLRRIEVAQSWHGKMVLSGEDVIYYGDPWRDDLQRISKKGRQTMKLSQLGASGKEAIGNIAALALYPDGDLGLATMNQRFLRLRPKPIEP